MALPSSDKFFSNLFEHLYYKLSDQGYHDMWNIGGFVVLFIFTTLTLTLMLTMFVWWCCERSTMNRVGVMPVPPIEEPEKPQKVTVASQTSQAKPAVEVVVLVPECSTHEKQPKNVQEKKWKWFQSKKTSDVLPV